MLLVSFSFLRLLLLLSLAHFCSEKKKLRRSISYGSSREYYKFCTHHRQYINQIRVHNTHNRSALNNLSTSVFTILMRSVRPTVFCLPPFPMHGKTDKKSKPNISHTHFFKAKPIVKKESETLSQHQQQQMRIESLVRRHFGVQCIHRRHTFCDRRIVSNYNSTCDLHLRNQIYVQHSTK